MDPYRALSKWAPAFVTFGKDTSAEIAKWKELLKSSTSVTKDTLTESLDTVHQRKETLLSITRDESHPEDIKTGMNEPSLQSGRGD